MQLHTLQEQVFSGLKLLILDNNSDVRELFSFVFEDFGGEVICTSTAKGAMELLDNFSVDIIISELTLPEEDGYSFMRKVKSHQMSNGKEIPAIAISSWLSKSAPEEAMLAGFDLFICKPVLLEDITEKISALVRQKNYHLN